MSIFLDKNVSNDEYIPMSTDFVDMGELFNNNQNDNNVSTLKNASSNASGEDVDILELSNVVIFIYFSDEQKPTSIGSKVDNFEGQDNSLYDYYNDLTYGKILIDSVFAKENDTIYYAYQDVKTRNYYESCYDTTENGERRTLEKELLTAAVNGFNSAMDYLGVNLDKNDNGFVDNISFVVSGSYNATLEKQWSTLMWPHAWDFASILNVSKDSIDVKLNGVKVYHYTLNFFDNLTTGLLCHEFSHILGSPDLYHYKTDNSDIEDNYLPVGNWDLMHYECDTPQYLTAYMREHYIAANSDTLKYIYQTQIGQITNTGTFSLKPTTMVTSGNANDNIAYKININEYESIWIEYRNKDVSTYDSDLAGSGLIVYRINTKEYNGKTGNQTAVHQSTSYPYEIYVYRPDASSILDLKTREKENLNKAYISQSNSKFRSLGKEKDDNSIDDDDYDSECIFTSDGRNTGIKINLIGESDESIQFQITIPTDLSCASQVSSINVWDREKYETNEQTCNEIDVSYHENDEILKNRVMDAIIVVVTYNDYSSMIATVSQYQCFYDNKQIGVPQPAKIKFSDSENENIEAHFTLTIKAEAFTATLTKMPDKTVYQLNEDLNLAGLELSLEYPNMATQVVRYNDSNKKANFSFIGFDKTTSGQYDVRITYTDENGYSDFVGVAVTVEAEIVNLEIDVINSKAVVLFTSTGNNTNDKNLFMSEAKDNYINAIAIYSDNSKQKLDKENYEINDFVWSGINTRYNLGISLISNNTITSGTFSILILDSSTTINDVSLQTLPKSSYNYGESLDLSNGIILLKTNTSNYDLPLQSYYNVFAEDYNCIKLGWQTLSAVVLGKRISFNVQVSGDTFALMTSNTDNVYLNITSKKILVDNACTLEELTKSIASTFNISWYYKSNKINPLAYVYLQVSDYLNLELTNEFGDIIVILDIYVTGDTNSDGILNKYDLDNLAAELLSRQSNNFGYDVSKDGRYDIIDFTMLVERTKNE